MAERYPNRHVLGEPIRDQFNLSSVEVVEFSTHGLVIRSLESHRMWGVELNHGPEGEEIEVTELESEVDG